MPKVLSLLLALAGLSVFAGPAPANVVSKHVGQDPDSVRAFWTDERMRTAIPADRARFGAPQEQARKPGGGGSTSSWSTLKVSWPGTEPALQAHGKVFFSDGPYGYVCSGTAVGGANGSVVWTAGHCVNEGPGDFYDSNWMFVPAYNANGRAPYGEWTAADLFTTAPWASTANAYGHDLGAARVGTINGRTLAQTLPAVRALDLGPADYTTGTANPIDSYGYPAEGKYSGSAMYLCDSYVSRSDTRMDPDTRGIPCGMNGGSSGGGWLDADTRAVVSVNSYGYSSVKNTMFGPVQDTPQAATLYGNAGATGN